MDQPLKSPARRALDDAFHAMFERSRTEPAPTLGVVHWVVLLDASTPTALEQTRTETVAVETPARPMLAMARLETTPAAGSAAWAGDEVPWIEYSIALRAAEFSEVATSKK